MASSPRYDIRRIPTRQGRARSRTSSFLHSIKGIVMPSYVSRTEAARILSELGLPTSPQTLANLASEGHGPTFAVWGRASVYEVTELHRWADARLAVEPRPAPKSARAAA